MIGQTLGHYKILEKLGAGGMGEVYLAEDTTLKRQVALKVLPATLAASQERLERFQREAETLATLDHPNIITIHSVEEAEGVRFLTMQLVQGQSLSKLIPKGGMPLEQIFEIGVPLADALAAAHEKGIVHRDLKPSNVMVTDEGRVKVLDFGLAKLHYGLGGAGATELPTEPLTDEGRVLGTVPYMSPEQTEGKTVDHRSDLFSLGVMLYEMATGRRPFQGDSPASTMSAILRDTPSSVIDLRADLPRQLGRIIRRCLVKEPGRRFQTARELAIEVEELRSEVASGEAWAPVAPPPRRLRAVVLSSLGPAVVVLVATLAVVVWVLSTDRQTTGDGTTAGVATHANLVFDRAQKGKVSASPDGRFFAYASDASGNWDIYLRRIAGGRAINLTEDSPMDDRHPAFSPDGESIAFRSEREGGGIFIMGATGESVRRVTDDGFLPAWSPDGTEIVFSTSGTLVGRWSSDIDARIWVVDLASENLQMVVDRSALMPAWSPNGLWIAYYGEVSSSETESQYDLFTLPANGGVPIAITDDVHFERSPAWSPDGRGLYYISDRGGSSDLWRVRIDEKTGRRVGEPEAMTSGSSVADVSPSGDGNRILYAVRAGSSEILRVPFDPVAEEVTGPAAPITPPGLRALLPAVSPDGEWIAFSAEFGHPDSLAIGVVGKDGDRLRQVTDSGYRDAYPDWSSDGQRLVFQSNRSGSAQAWIVNTDGGGLRQLTDTPGIQNLTPRLSPDGSQLSTEVEGEGGGAYVYQVEPSSEGPPIQLPLVSDDESFRPLSWSPDGKLLAGVTEARRSQDDRGGPRSTRSTGRPETRIALYSFDSRGYRVLTEPLGTSGDTANPSWFNGGRRIFFGSSRGSGETTYSILDTETGERHEVFTSESLALKQGGEPHIADISRNGRDVYVSWHKTESVIRMLTLRDQE